MRLLILCPGDVPKSVDGIRCFTQVLNYYIPNNLKSLVDVKCVNLPLSNDEKVLEIFKSLDDSYDCVLALGLRYFSRIPSSFLFELRKRVKCPIVQMHDGSRFNLDGVDLTLTFKEMDSIAPHMISTHKKYNKCVGWAADHEMFDIPKQLTNVLNVLIDHTNYNGGKDYSLEILEEVFKLKNSNVWKDNYTDVVIKRLGSGTVEDVHEIPSSIEEYDRTRIIPVTVLSDAYKSADVFVVTHPESLGLVVLETAMCGSLVVCKEGFVGKDRLNTVNHYSYKESIDWNVVLSKVNREENRKKAIENSWSRLASNIVKELTLLTGNK